MTLARLSILGIGLLGGSLALAAKNRIRGCQVIGYAHRKQTLEAAMARGIFKEVYQSPQPAVKEADLVVLCTPVSMLSPLLEQISSELRPGAIVTDVGSTKRSVVAAGERCLGSNAHFVGSHPMAGSEKRGLQFAREDLYDGALCITTPTSQTDPDALRTVEEFWQAIGMRTTRLSPHVHDQLLADVSHLPHSLAGALVSMQQDKALELCGKGFMDMTRIAAGDAGLWRDILLDNRDSIRQSLGRLTESLEHLDRLLQAGDAQSIEKWLATAAERRRDLNDRHPNPSESTD